MRSAGQERYHCLAKLYSRDAKLIILVYDITDRLSFDGMKKWYEGLKKDGIDSDSVICIFGNKEDLIENEVVTLEEAKKYSDSINAIFKKTSAKLNIGIEEGFFELSKKYLKFFERTVQKQSLVLSEHVALESKAQKSKCC